MRIYEKESGDLSIPNVWVELDQSLKPQRNEEYVVSCSEEFLDETQRYLRNLQSILMKINVFQFTIINFIMILNSTKIECIKIMN